MKLLIAPDAEDDILREFIYLGTIDPGLGERWLASVDNTIRVTITGTPEIGLANRFESERLRDIRRFPVKGFPKYLVFYRIADDVITVVNVLHGARDIDSHFENRDDD